jgi:hypothetical protein
VGEAPVMREQHRGRLNEGQTGSVYFASSNSRPNPNAWEDFDHPKQHQPFDLIGAGDGNRTHDIQLWKLRTHFLSG